MSQARLPRNRKEKYLPMAKGSVRKKGNKWYYRFYVEDESGRLVQREFTGTASKSETEAMLRKAMEDYEAKKFVAKAENITVGGLLDLWVEEELKPGNLSNGTVMAYTGTVGRIKQYPIGGRKVKTVTPEHLQAFFRSPVLRRRQRGRHDSKADQQGLYAPVLGGDAGRVSLCGVSQAADDLQPDAVCED